ncbi:hypothetical protein SRB5_28480 [Streptomyces sp. RB5]|uniref:DUF397 domain-containing protein n=1 Tax=Streptomyces smaragdinus TaxID=2585196 RepID=A0A7K0CGV0_9ACTN|nr:DUF397 domain-containing protein [Streptomyces smaragdinus]MQY12709.1 hypothetical protein [Streptomyces smaragdinus]
MTSNEPKRWTKSTYSSGAGGECVEVATTSAHVHVRDSKNPTGPHLTFTPEAWRAFITALAG